MSPAYVLDEMQSYEMSALMERFSYKDRSAWEQARFVAYVMAQVNSTKKLSATDLLTFPWEKEEKEPVEITDSDVDRLKKKMNQYIAEKTRCPQI